MAYLKLFRFPLVFTAIADSAAGYLLTCGSRPDPLTLVLLAVASGGLYCFGMAMNDVADRDRDRELYPHRVLPSGRLSVRAAGIASLGVLMVSLIAVVLVPTPYRAQPPVAWALIVGAIMLYDFGLKSPLIMGLIRHGNLFLGVMVLIDHQGILSTAFPWLGASLLVYVAALTYVSTLEEGKVSGLTVAVGAAFMAFGAALPALLGTLSRLGPASTPAGWYAAVPLIAWIIYRGYMAEDRKGVMLLVRDGVGGIILVDASMLLASGLLLQGAAVAGLLLPAAIGVAIFKRLA